MSMEDEKNPAVAGSAAGAPAPASVPSATAAPEPPRRTAEQNLELFSVNPPGASEVAQGAAEIADAGAREAEEAEKARTASQNALRAAGVATVAAFERYAAGDGSPASQRAAIFAARTLGDRLAEKYNIEGGVTETIEFDRNGDFHLRFWRKKDGFPLGFDYNQMRDGLQRQGFLDDLDGELKQKLGIEAPKPEVLGKNGKPLSAGEYFGGISGMDAATRRAYSNSIGAANLFFGGDEEAMTHYFETLEAQEKPAAPQVDPREAFRKEYFDAKGRGEKAFALDALKRYEGDLDPEFVAAIRGELDADDWGIPAPAAGKGSSGEPAEPAEQDWHKTFQEKYNAAKDPASKALVVDIFSQVLGEKNVVKFTEQIEREAAAGSAGKTSTASGASVAGGASGVGVEGTNSQAAGTERTVRFASGDNGAPASGETAERNSVDDGAASNGTIHGNNPSDDPFEAVLARGEQPKDGGGTDPNTPPRAGYAKGGDFNRGRWYDEDAWHWDESEGKWKPNSTKNKEEGWDVRNVFSRRNGNGDVVSHPRFGKDGNVTLTVQFWVDDGDAEYLAQGKDGIRRPVKNRGAGWTEDSNPRNPERRGSKTAEEMLRRLGAVQGETRKKHGGEETTYSLTREQYDLFVRFAKNMSMPPKRPSSESSKK